MGGEKTRTLTRKRTPAEIDEICKREGIDLRVTDLHEHAKKKQKAEKEGEKAGMGTSTDWKRLMFDTSGRGTAFCRAHRAHHEVLPSKRGKKRESNA